jgi:hypothetical protein
MLRFCDSRGRANGLFADKARLPCLTRLVQMPPKWRDAANRYNFNQIQIKNTQILQSDLETFRCKVCSQPGQTGTAGEDRHMQEWARQCGF